jgi:hypothetical protein
MLLLQCLAISLASFRVDDWTNLERGRWAVTAGRVVVWTQMNPFGLFRPLVDYWHGTMLSLFGLSPRPMVAMLVLLLLATTLMLSRLVRERGGNRLTAALAMAAVWVQPNTYVWTTLWVSNVTAALVAFFSLATLLQYHRAVRRVQQGRRAWHLFITMVLLFVLGALCREEIVLLPGVLLVLEWARWPRLALRARRAAVFGIVLVGAVAVSYALVRTKMFPPIPGSRYDLALGAHALTQLRFFSLHLGALLGVLATLSLCFLPAVRQRATWSTPEAAVAIRESMGGIAWAAVGMSLFMLISGRPAYGYLYVPAFATSYAVARMLGFLCQQASKGATRIPVFVACHALLASGLTIWGLLDVRWPRYASLTREAFAAVDAAVPAPEAGTLFAFVDPGERETRAGRTVFSMIFDGFVGSMVRLHYGRDDIDAVLVNRREDIPSNAAAAFVARHGHLERIR